MTSGGIKLLQMKQIDFKHDNNVERYYHTIQKQIIYL
jgi:hypothetical protein